MEELTKEEKEMRKEILRKKNAETCDTLSFVWLVLFLGWLAVTVLFNLPKAIGLWVFYPNLGKFPLNAVMIFTLWLLWTTIITILLRFVIKWLRRKSDKEWEALR